MTRRTKVNHLVTRNEELRAEIARLKAAHRHIQGIAEQAEVYHARMGASQTFAAIADAAKAAVNPTSTALQPRANAPTPGRSGD